MPRGRPDFSPTSADVVLRPEWRANEGVDKNFIEAEVALVGYGLSAAFTYVVTLGKILYITDFGFTLRASAAANAELNQIGFLIIRQNHGGGIYTDFGHIGGNGGAHWTHSKPTPVERLPGSLEFRLYNYSNHACVGTISVYGYEV